MCGKFDLRAIGIIRTPYIDRAPRQPREDAPGEFKIVLREEYIPALARLEDFRYIYVIYFADRVAGRPQMLVSPPHAPSGMKVGLFASRSPARPNPILIDVARVKRVAGKEVFTSCLDALDGTPLLDIKPYIREIDSKPGADGGWLDKGKPCGG